MEPTVLLIGGKKGAGKDAAADILVDHWGFRKMGFADPIKEVIGRDLFQLTDAQMDQRDLKKEEDPFWGLTPRQILQKTGTDAFKPVFGKDFWAKAAVRKIQESHHDLWVIKDARFPIELEVLQEAFTRTLTVNIDARKRLGINLSWWKRWLTSLVPGLSDIFGTQYHPSETALDGYADWDLVIDNNGSERSFEDKIYALGRFLAAHDYDPNHHNLRWIKQRTRKRLKSQSTFSLTSP